METNKKYSLLDEPIISISLHEGGSRSVSLPELFPLLQNNQVLGFEKLQLHQQQAWYSFLVQLGAMAVSRETNGNIPDNSETWKEALLGLSGGLEEAWHLVVEDVSKPAFMQPPVPEGSLDKAAYKPDISTPDELDMLVTSKNHDLKSSRILHPRIEHWLFSLITLQTMEGFLGQGNYGIVRMNGGFGNRPLVGFAPDFSWGNRVMRDLNVLVRNRNHFTEMYSEDGIPLLWLKPWNGSMDDSLPLYKCDPYFIEICRRIRFRISNGREILCLKTNTKAARIYSAEDLKGRTGDPWTPINKSDAKALTPGASGFTYEILQQLLLGEDYDAPITMKFQREENSGMLLTTQALVRGQGKTDGLHIRMIPVPSRVFRLFQDANEKQKLADRASLRVKETHDMQNRVLKPALGMILYSGEGQNIDYKNLGPKVRPWLDSFDKAIDRLFFESLWESVDQSTEQAKRNWQQLLYREAKKLLEEAERSISMSQIRRWKAISQARDLFYGSIRKHFPGILQQKTTSDKTEETL